MIGTSININDNNGAKPENRDSKKALTESPPNMECIGPSVLYPNHEFDILPALAGDFLLKQIIMSIKLIIVNITKSHINAIS